MPPSLRARRSRATSARPYGRRSPTASPVRTTQPLITHVDPDPVSTDPIATSSNVTAPPDRPGLPTYAAYKRVEAGYLQSLSPRKRDKALITQAMFDKIWDVLHQPDACTVDTPQFRFWVRKMFRLSQPMLASEDEQAGWTWGAGAGAGEGGEVETMTNPCSDADAEAEDSAYLYSPIVLHENRPVAIMEQLYELFCYCHVRAGHGGRDKTCAVIRQHYSWVPKELTAQFVKACPTCAVKRSGGVGMSSSAGVGASVGVYVGGQRRARTRKTPKESAEVPVASLPCLEWPTTGGPLDPANPQPCGVHEQERLWFSVQSSPAVSPLPTMAVAASSPLSGRLNSESDAQGQPSRTPTRTATGLPSLTSALSNKSLEENVRLHLHLSPTRHAPADPGDPSDSGRRLPPALQSLQLSGPCAPGLPSSCSPRSLVSGSSSSSSSGDASSSLTSSGSPPAGIHDRAHLFEIDPILLSFDYPGLEDARFPWYISGVTSVPVFAQGHGSAGERPGQNQHDTAGDVDRGTSEGYYGGLPGPMLHDPSERLSRSTLDRYHCTSSSSSSPSPCRDSHRDRRAGGPAPPSIH